jgi:hypothetical protein
MPSIPGIASGQLLLYAIYDVADEADLGVVERVVRARTNADERISRLQLERQRTSVTFANPPVAVRLGDRSLLMVQHMDFVEGIERVTAAVKVTEDFYYATVYRGAMKIFRAEEIIEATNRKLDLMFRTYTGADEVDSATSHRLELIIVLLIVFEIIITIVNDVIR